MESAMSVSIASFRFTRISPLSGWARGVAANRPTMRSFKDEFARSSGRPVTQ